MSNTSGVVVRCIREEFPTIDAVCRQLEQQVDLTRQPQPAVEDASFCTLVVQRTRVLENAGHKERSKERSQERSKERS